MTDAATRAQNAAAHPDKSTWLTANAGSGKTRVLTNRVARLLLNGVEPQNILCLTYTKAAANEMQNRLFTTLGHWAMLDEPMLINELGMLGENMPLDVRRARTLFAAAIETPGGLKIQTIHSFCSKVLRQFPLEAGVNPQFRELDERGQADLFARVIDEIALHSPKAIQDVRRSYSGESLTDLARDIAKNSELFEETPSKNEVFKAFGISSDQTYEAIAVQAVSTADIKFLKSIVPILQTSDKMTDLRLAEQFEGLPAESSAEAFAQVQGAVLTTDLAKIRSRLVTKSISENSEFGPLSPEFMSLCERVLAAKEQMLALESANQAIALQDFAQQILPRYRRLKSSTGQLDFDDLIKFTKQLLTSRSMEWVLYRLDGRIDHVLVDEAQDTSPMQWDVIEALTSEITAGEVDRLRTLFVVGDKKQSIYSFQGADTEGFDRRANKFESQLQEGMGLNRHELRHSFRSSSAILDLVDAVFSKASGAGEPTKHFAFHDRMPGRVDLWPLLPKPEEANLPPWYDLSDRTVENDVSLQLADCISSEIETLLKCGTIQGKDGVSRRVAAGDIMVLVQRRSALFDRIISACKAKGLPIAGADRLKVGSELAVRDILALLSFVALPEDDLSLATALRSPIIGWSEQELFDLAARRKEGSFLWQALRDRRFEFDNTYEVLKELRRQVDFLRPFELIDVILTKFEGRRKLLRRLGVEAEDGIDELLNQALAYEQKSVPSLTGFLAYADASDIEVKREAESGDLIRVMTVHGAKGLESPIVILPDTTHSRPRTGQDIIAGPNGIPVLPRGKSKCPEILLKMKADRQSADEAERDRLLYVAMTRAERWLIMCGIAPNQSPSENLNWHQKVSDALSSLETELLACPTGQGLRYSVGEWSERVDASDAGVSPTPPPPELPAFRKTGTLHRERVLSPSELDGAKVLSGQASSSSGGTKKGRRLHLLLEKLPGSEDPEGLARTLLSHGRDAATEEEVSLLVDEATAVFAAHPDVFGPNSLAEVDVVATSPTLASRISGAIDRLLVDDERVLAVDFKTNALVPNTPEDTPVGILRQMGAYLEALEGVYSGRQIDVAVLWTETGKLMPLPHGIVRDALHTATTS